MKLFKKAKKGFTLVELVVVIAVIAILAAVSVGAYFGVTDSANRSKLEQEAKQTFEAIRLISLADPQNNQSLGIDGLTLDTSEDGVAEFTNDLMYATGQTYTVSLEDKPQEGITGKTVVLYKNFLDLGTSNANGANQTYKSFNYYTNEVKSYAANVNLINGKIEIISDEFEITPPPAATAVTGVSLNTTSYSMLTGTTYTLSATVTPETATDKSVTWSSSDANVVTVNNGVVTAVGAGTATVIVTTTDGSKTATCTFKVTDPVYDAEAIGITTTAPENFYVGDAPITLEAQITPAYTTDKTITWSSSAPEVASVVAETGVVTPLAKGTAVITAKTHNDKTATITIVVKQHATQVELDQESISMHVGDNDIQLNATVTPDNAENKNVTWESSNESVATVNNGLVKAVGNGNATITVKTVDGGHTDTCSVSVSTHATSVTINQGDSVEVNENGTLQLTATVLPETSSYTTITWESSNENKATVDANGLVTAAANSKGNVTITASCDGKEDNITVNILRPVGSLRLNKSETSINVGEEETLVATFNPEAPSNPGIIWASNSDAATVDQNGKVTAVKMGTATITASSVENNTIVASCVVTVIQPITSITLSASSLTLTEGDVSEVLTYTVEPAENSFAAEEGAWTSNKESVATVAGGVVTAVAPGQATISFTKAGVSAQCVVTVTKAPVPVTGITVTPETAEVEEGKTGTLTAAVAPADADNKNVVWSSSDDNTATVNEGVVTGVKAGTVTITAKTEDGNFTATATITVTEKPETIEVKKYVLVTSASEISVGTKLIFAAKDSNVAMGHWDGGNNFPQVDINKSNNELTFDESKESLINFVTVEAGTVDNTYSFKSSKTGKYIYAASSGSNHMKEEDTKSANSSFKITISNDVATMVAQGSNTRNTMQYNSSSSLFSCYSSASQKAISLYKEVVDTITVGAPDHIDLSNDKISVSVGDNTSYTLTAIVKDSNSNVLNNKIVNWSIENGEYINGTADGNSYSFKVKETAGTVRITASINGITASCVVTIQEKPAVTYTKIVDSITFKQGDLAKAGSTIKVGNSSFSYGTAGYLGFDSSKGLQIGSKDNPVTSYYFSTILPKGYKFVSLKANLSIASSGTCKVSFTCGNLGSPVTNKSLTTTATDYSFNSSDTTNGVLAESNTEIKLSFTNGARAWYIKNLEFTYYKAA